MTENQVIPYLGAKSDSVLRSRMIKICGIGESTVEERLLDLIDAQTNPTIATYAKPREVHVRVTAKAPTAEEAEEILMPVVREITGRFPREVFTTEEKETLEDVVVRMLKEQGLLFTAAESCTAGMLSARLVNVSGASDVFRGSFITYSDKAKHRRDGCRSPCGGQGGYRGFRNRACRSRRWNRREAGRTGIYRLCAPGQDCCRGVSFPRKQGKDPGAGS